MMQFGTRIDTSGDHAVVVIEGDVDMAAAPTLRSILQRTIDAGSTWLIIDLTECTLIDSAGMGMMLGALRRARSVGGRVELVVPSPNLRRVFEACDLDRVFTLHETVGGATQTLASAAESNP